MARIAACLLVAALMSLAGCAASPAASGPTVPTVTMRGQPVTLEGTPPTTGQRAPAFDAVANDMSTYQFTPGHGQVYILSSVPSIDTPVCSVETRHFNEDAARLPAKIHVLTVSMDLPFAQKRWCAAEGVARVTTLSDSRDRSFAGAYGLRMKQTGLLARAVFVVGPDGRIVYRQIVPEISQQPDYAAALDAATRAAKSSS